MVVLLCIDDDWAIGVGFGRFQPWFDGGNVILGENKEKIECSGSEMGVLASVGWLICGVVCSARCDVEEKREKGGQGVEKGGFRFVKSELSPFTLHTQKTKKETLRQAGFPSGPPRQY